MNLDDIKKRLASATTGLYKVERYEGLNQKGYMIQAPNGETICYYGWQMGGPEASVSDIKSTINDLDFLANAWKDVTDLVEKFEEVEEELHDLRRGFLDL